MATTSVNELGKIVQDSRAGNRDVISAAKALLSASKINLQSVSVTIKARNEEELEVRMTEIEREIEVRKSNRPGY